MVYLIWRQSQETAHDSFVAAILCGLGSEAVLRSRFYFGERKAADGNIEEVSKGVFDLVRWYQVLFLKNSGEQLADERRRFNERLMAGQTDFLRLCSRARLNAGAWPIESEKQRLLSEISRLQVDFNLAAKGLSGQALQQLQNEFITEFCYAVMRLVRRKSLGTLIK